MTSQNTNMDSSLQDIFSCSTIFSTNFDTNSDYENLRIVFEDVLRTVSIVDAEENVFKVEIPKLKSYTLEVVNKINDTLRSDVKNEFVFSEIKDLLKTYINLLKLSQEAIKYIDNKVQFSLVPSLPLAITEILFQTFQHCKESDTIYGEYFTSLTDSLTALFKKANEIQSNLINLINNLLMFDLSDQEQLDTLVKVVGLFSSIGEIVSSLDIKTTAEIWKAYIVVSQSHNQFLKSKVNIDNTLKYHCKQITVALENVIKSSDMKFVEKSLKISSFNLKIIIKLSTLYKNNLGDPYIHLFDLLILLNRYSIPYLHMVKTNPKLIDFIQMYVGVGAEPLLGCLIEDREFSQIYFKNINKQFENDNTKLSAMFLTVSIIKKILNTNKNLWVSTQLEYNIINVIIYNFDKLHFELSSGIQITLPAIPGETVKKDSLYLYILLYTSVIVISLDVVQIKTIQQLLLRSLLQTNAWKSIFVIDLWCILARYANTELCFKQLQLLITIFLKLTNQNRPEYHFLSILINRLYQLLSNKYKLDLLNKYPSIEYPKIWTSIGLQTVTITNVTNTTKTKIEDFLKSKTNPTLFISMCDYLQLLSTNKHLNQNEIATKLVKEICKLWALNFNNDITQSDWFLKFIKIRTDITCILINSFNNTELLMVLNIVTELNQTSLTSKCCNTNILKSLAAKTIQNTSEQTEIFEKITQLFKVLLKDSNPLIRQMTLAVFSHFAYITKHEQILANVVERDQHLQDEISNYLQRNVKDVSATRTSYLNAQNGVGYRHKCVEKSAEPALKKTKRFSMKETIERFMIDCDSIIDYAQTETIPNEYVTELNIIVDKLRNIIQK